MVWGTFESSRKHLENQFEETIYLPETGCSIEQLNDMVKEYLKDNADYPVIQKANIYRIIVTNGQIAADPLDWFADKLAHGNILHRFTDRRFNYIKTHKLPYHSSFLDLADKTGYFHSVLDLGHISPGWSFMLENGLKGLLEKAEEYRIEKSNLALEAYEELKTADSAYSLIFLIHKCFVTRRSILKNTRQCKSA